MVADTRQTQPVSAIAPTQSWERYREDAREAVLARLLNVTGASGLSGGARPPGSAGLPHGLVRATVLQANSDTEALVNIAGKPYLVNTRQPLSPGVTLVLRLLDDRTFLHGQEDGRIGGPRSPGTAAGAGRRSPRPPPPTPRPPPRTWPRAWYAAYRRSRCPRWPSSSSKPAIPRSC